MKKKSMKWLRMSFILMILGIILSLPTRAFADGKPYFSDTHDLFSIYNSSWYSFGEEGDSIKFSNLKSSNSKVVTVSTRKEGKRYFIIFKIKKVGKATVSFNAKCNGHTYSYMTNVRVWKYKNPVKTLKIGKNSFASRFNNFPSYEYKSKKLSGKIKLTLNKGWKFDSADIYSTTSSYYKHYSTLPSSVSLKKNQTLAINVKNKKYGYRQTVYIYIH